jgi:hypothetical protein
VAGDGQESAGGLGWGRRKGGQFEATLRSQNPIIPGSNLQLAVHNKYL